MLFQGRGSVITVRELIKWGSREFASMEEFAFEGFCVLAERLRSEEDREAVKAVIQRTLKVQIDERKHYSAHFKRKGKILSANSC